MADEDTNANAGAPVSEDDWAAAMSEQAASDGEAAAADTATATAETPPEAAGDGNTEDDWAAAMSEQAAAENQVDPEAVRVAADLASAAGESPYQAKPASQLFEDLGDSTKPGSLNDFDMILDIPVQITVELGRTKITIRNLLQLAHGSVVELDGLAGEPMDVLVNGTLIAQGEVVVVNDKFGIRLTDIITPAERMRKIHH